MEESNPSKAEENPVVLSSELESVPDSLPPEEEMKEKDVEGISMKIQIETRPMPENTFEKIYANSENEYRIQKPSSSMSDRHEPEATRNPQELPCSQDTPLDPKPMKYFAKTLELGSPLSNSDGASIKSSSLNMINVGLKGFSLSKSKEVKGIIKVKTLWDSIKKEPENFVSWEMLIKESEILHSTKVETDSFNSQHNLRRAYVEFLDKFPLCYGYWRKLADFEFSCNGVGKAIEIYELGLKAIQNSVDLWVYFLSFLIEHLYDATTIRNIFNRGASFIGFDFQSHPFWNKYLDFEKRLNNMDNVFEILSKLISMPLHQNSKYFEEYLSMVPDRTPRDILGAQLYSKYEAEIRHTILSDPKIDKETFDVEKAILEQLAIRAKKHYEAIFEAAQKETSLRWSFEGEIKRAYFHVKALESSQLHNWKRYLAFEEGQGDEKRIEALYERCLVPCAQYQEIWTRYAQWLVSKDQLSKAEDAYRRATTTFISPRYTTIRLNYALLLEALNKFEEARMVYQKQLDFVPGHLETIYKFIHFERRLNPGSFKQVISDYLESGTLRSDSKAFLSSQLANFVWKKEGDPREAARLFSDYISMYPDSEHLWSEYMRFCINSETSLNALGVVDRLIKSKMSASFIGDTITSYLGHLIEHSIDATVITKLQSLVFRYETSRPEPSRKRSLEQEANGEGSRKLKKPIPSAPTPITKPPPRPLSPKRDPPKPVTKSHRSPLPRAPSKSYQDHRSHSQSKRSISPKSQRSSWTNKPSRQMSPQPYSNYHQQGPPASHNGFNNRWPPSAPTQHQSQWSPGASNDQWNRSANYDYPNRQQNYSGPSQNSGPQNHPRYY